MHYRLEDVQRHFQPVAWERGASYFARGRVRDCRVADGGELLSGKVHGRGRRLYTTQVQVLEGGRRVYSRCSCPVGRGCKHVVALLLQGQKAEGESPLGPDISAWIDDLFAVHRRRDERRAVPVEIRYECRVPQDHPEPHVAISCRKRRPGTEAPQRGKALSFNARLGRDILPAADRRLIGRLRSHADESPYVARLAESGGGELLDELVRSGRCYWEKQTAALRHGSIRRAQARWRLQDDGSQLLELTLADGGRVLPLEPLRYIDPETAEYGEVGTALSPELVPLLFRAPRIEPQQLDEFIELLDERGIDGLPRPEKPRTETLDVQAPQPRLTLMHLDDLVERDPGYVPDVFVARLQACYGGDLCFEAGDGEPVQTRRRGERLLRIERDTAAEAAMREALPEFQDIRVPGAGPGTPRRVLTPAAGAAGWLDFLDRSLPALEAAGWLVEQRESFRLDVIEPERWALETTPRGDDWFELSAGFEIDGEPHNLLEILVEWLREQPDTGALRARLNAGGALAIELGEGRLLRLPAERARDLLETFVELFRERPLNRAGRLKLHRLDLARLAERDGAWAWEAPRELRRFAASLTAAPPPAREPEAFQGRLRGYQKAGLAWMQRLDAHRLGGILADDMGLGKTVQTLAHLARLDEEEPGAAPSLIVAPTSVLGNWRAEAGRFTPQLSVQVWHGAQREAGQLDGARLVITSYATLLRDLPLLAAREWRLLVVDEAQMIKNPQAKISRGIKSIRAGQRLCLTGTPMENHLGELWSLFDFLAPGFLGDARSFRQLYRKPIEERGDEARAAQLRRRIQPFVLRRRKEEVATELPPKSEMLRSIELGPRQADLYESIRVSMQQKLRQTIAARGLERSHIEVLDALLKLRQVCCDPRLLKLDSAQRVGESAKLDALAEMLPALVEDGRRILLFSQFTSMLALIEERLHALGLEYLLLTGKTRHRDELVARFQNGEVPLFLISLKAGGTGLNLTAADTVIHYDPWWNPAVENQATDRAHRIGQDKPVFVYKLICADTVEARIQAMQAHKQALADRLEPDEPAVFGAEDIDRLLQPIA